MRCSGLHCSGCKSGAGASRLALMLGAGTVGALVLYRVAGSALPGVSASAATANRLVGLAVAVVLVVAVVTAGGWVLLARRRQVREEPVVAEFGARVQAALDARAAATAHGIAPGPSASPALLTRLTSYRLDGGPMRREVGS